MKVLQDKWNTSKWHCRIRWKIASDFSCCIKPSERERIDCWIELSSAFNRGIKKLVNNQRVPNLAKYKSIQDFIMRNQKKVPQAGSTTADSLGAYSSESEVDDLPGSKVVLPEDYQDKKKNTSVAIRLHELGPRLKLRLIKIQEGFCRGNVVFHAHQAKTPAEIKKQLDALKD